MGPNGTIELTSDFCDDTLAYKDYKDILAHRVIMSATNMSRYNSQFLGATVHEFMQIWALNGDVTLNLTTSGGTVSLDFKCTLGQPGAHHSPPPSAPPSLHLLLLADPATVVRLRGRKTASGLPATKQLMLRQLLQCLL